MTLKIVSTLILAVLLACSTLAATPVRAAAKYRTATYYVQHQRRTHHRYYTNARGRHVRSPVRSRSVPAGATAECNDGTYSFSESRRGTCSHLLTSDDANSLTNKDRLSMYVTMTCLNGYFQDPSLESLAESLMKAPAGGAIGVWASSGMTGPVDQAMMNQQWYRLLFSGGTSSMSLGEATVRAKSATNDVDVRRTWILFGDPTMKLK